MAQRVRGGCRTCCLVFHRHQRTSLFSTAAGLAPTRTVALDAFDPQLAFDAQEPVVVKGLVSTWPAVSGDISRRWGGGQRFASVDSSVLVQVEVGGKNYMDPQMQLLQVSFREFAAWALANDGNDASGSSSDSSDSSSVPPVRLFLAQNHLDAVPPLMADVQAPSMTTTTGKGHLYRTNLWLCGPRGSESPAHHDPFHNLLCQVVGRKTVLLFPPSCGDDLYPALGTTQKNTSLVDFQAPDSDLLAKYPRVAAARRLGTEAMLEPGDALFIPRGHWHYCTATGTSCSVNFWWL